MSATASSSRSRTVARPLTLVLALLLVLLLAAGALVWWNAGREHPQRDAEAEAAASILDLREQSGQLVTPAELAPQIEADLQEQLDALDPAAVERAEDRPRTEAADFEQLLTGFGESADLLEAYGQNEDLNPEVRTVMLSAGVQHGLTEQMLRGGLEEAVTAPPRLEGAPEASETPDLRVWCAEPGEEDSGPNEQAAALLEQLDYLVWTEQSLLTRGEAGEPGSREHQRMSAALDAHEDQRDALRGGLETSCGEARAAHASYDPRIEGPADEWLRAQAQVLADQHMVLLRETLEDSAQETEGNDAARSLAYSGLGSATALAGAGTLDLPALPGL